MRLRFSLAGGIENEAWRVVRSVLQTNAPHAPRGEPSHAAREAFRDALASFRRRGPILLMGHNDADGLAAVAILARALQRAGRRIAVRLVGRGESPWSTQMAAEVAPQSLAGVIVADLGLRDGFITETHPVLVIDHHVPRGGAQVPAITGFGLDPIPTSSLLAFWCAGQIADADDLLWLAALGLIADMADQAGFREMDEARARYGVSALRKAAALLNAARRSAAGEAAPALALLLKSGGPKDVLSGRFPETAELLAAKAEVAAELELAKRLPPKVRGGVALIRLSSPCQIHPLIAQQWRGRLKNEIVIAANTGFRPGWIHFAARTATGADLIAFLAEHAPPGADENYGSGHVQATGGALRPRDWNIFVRRLSFGPEEEVPA
jgi:single-stranded-DNA-specific exonuclease